MQQTLKLPLKGKLKKMDIEFTDEDIAYKPGNGEVWLTKLLQKIKKSKAIIKSMYVNNELA